MGAVFQLSVSVKLKGGTIHGGRVRAVVWCYFSVSRHGSRNLVIPVVVNVRVYQTVSAGRRRKKIKWVLQSSVSSSCKYNSHEKSKFLEKKECLL